MGGGASLAPALPALRSPLPAACLYGTGVDLLSLTRFASLLARSRASAAVSSPHARLGRSERLARRILCDEELADWQRLEARHDRVRWLACRCAACVHVVSFH
jgi:phosphopantetheinyl transferase (holo-ACP synthase)